MVGWSNGRMVGWQATDGGSSARVQAAPVLIHVWPDVRRHTQADGHVTGSADRLVPEQSAVRAEGYSGSRTGPGETA